MHGTDLTIYVNKIAQDHIDWFQTDPESVVVIDFPNGSIIAKLNAKNPEMTDPKDPWLTVMFKLDTYCHATVGVTTGLCVGGDWFYYLFKDNKFSYFDGVPAYGKAKAFCIDCHDPVQRGDFLWTAFSGLLKAQKSTSKGGGSGDPGKNLADDCAGTSPLYLPPILPGVPGDVKSDPASKLPEQAQLMFDCLSWRSFLALNMEAQVEPAPGTTAEWRGLPRLGAGLTNEGPRVWETYRSVFETFQPGRPDWKLDKRSWDDPEHFVYRTRFLGHKFVSCGGPE